MYFLIVILHFNLSYHHIIIILFYFFPSCSGGLISLLHSFTSSLPHFLLDIWNPGGELSIWKGMECLWENLNLIPMRDLCGCFLSFIIPLKDATWNGMGLITSYCSREDPVGTSRLDSCNREISRNQAWKQKLSVFLNYYYFECTLNDTLTAKMMMFRRQNPKWDQNPWFVPKTTSISSTFAYVRVPPPPRFSTVQDHFTTDCTMSS